MANQAAVKQYNDHVRARDKNNHARKNTFLFARFGY